MILNEENVMTVQDGSIIMVLNPETDTYVECKVTEFTLPLSGPGIYLTTTDSDVKAANSFGNYRDYVHHLRGNDSNFAVMTRSIAA